MNQFSPHPASHSLPHRPPPPRPEERETPAEGLGGGWHSAWPSPS
jgi:hypothetical protein